MEVDVAHMSTFNGEILVAFASVITMLSVSKSLTR